MSHDHNAHRKPCPYTWTSDADDQGHRCARPLDHPDNHHCACGATRWEPGRG